MKQNEANREADTLKGIYEKYKQDGAKIEDAIQHIRTSKSLGPTAKTTAIKDMLELQKMNNQLVKEQQKIVAKDEKAAAKALEKERLDKVEKQLLDEIEGQDLTGSQIYKKAREAGLDSARASAITNRKHREAKEDRLTSSSIATEYNRERKSLISQLKATDRLKEKQVIQGKIDELNAKEKRDQKRLRSGEKKFDLELYKDEAIAEAEPAVQPVPFQQQEPQQQQAVMKLNATFSPQEWQGKSKWDKQGNEYKSDGSTWVLVQPTK